MEPLQSDKKHESVVIRGGSLWDAKVEPSLEGSGALKPNPTFPEELPDVPIPEIDQLFESLSVSPEGQCADCCGEIIETENGDKVIRPYPNADVLYR